MNRLKKLFGLFALSLIALAMPTFVSAQWQGNNRNGGYGNRKSVNLRPTVRDLKKQTAVFEKQIDRALEKNRRQNRTQGNSLSDLARQFKNAAADLESKYSSDRDFNKTGDKARRVLDLGYQIQDILRRSRIANLEYDWTPIGQDLDRLAGAYGYDNNNDRNHPSSRWRNNFPFPPSF